jgi:hypothetical protein
MVHSPEWKLLVNLQMKNKLFNSETEAKDIYRVFVNTKGGAMLVKVDQIGIDMMGEEEPIKEGWYDNVNELPMWLQEKVAVLAILDPSIKPAQTVKGIGRRIDHDTFWVYR